MEQQFAGISCAFYTVKQLSALFGKSEDTIRRWKNEGIGKEEDNIKLRALEREDGSGRKNARHLVFSREAVIEFVKANPFLMDDAPQLGLMMQAEGAWSGGALPMPGTVGEWPDDEAAGSEAQKNRGETGFAAAVRRIKEEALGRGCEDNEETCGQAPFRRNFESRREHPGFEHRTYRSAPPHGFGFEDEDDFGSFPGEEENRGWRRSMPRGGRASRKAAEAELQRRMQTVDFALGVLRERISELEKQHQELEDAVTELEISDIEEKTQDSIRRVLIQKKEELTRQMDMLEEFVDVIEEEMGAE